MTFSFLPSALFSSVVCLLSPGLCFLFLAFFSPRAECSSKFTTVFLTRCVYSGAVGVSAPLAFFALCHLSSDFRPLSSVLLDHSLNLFHPP
jgi:hypothetical protein